ncbi:MAG TPA: NYN domain-containing protein, partial [Chloroflexota bacterium]|nr:NYN domain-containing protein [Chloroflexota bacterium]
MPRDEENYVALFIDWDNLAISTAVDFAGAVPDVRAIVRAAQRSGTVLLARAYAEWNVSSDRLSVYRAGVEPVYAPTFRFEPEPGSQVPRGKSLADPCLVTDCIDTMHLMPAVNIFCLVSGDKDLIPIVRLAQLRGKRVVVIGPDFVAAILREMADEYIPYRGLVEITEGAATTEVSLPAPRGQRRVSAPQARIGSGTTPISRAQTPSRVASSPGARPSPADANVNGNGDGTDVSAASVIAEAPADAPSTDEALDSAPLFETIGTIVREREQNGKPRLRATNLKDQLLARISGFDERKYGFSRFKDLLTAAEKAGVIVVSRTGPVQWVTSANAPTPVSATPVGSNAPADAPVDSGEAPVTPPGDATASRDPGDTDVDLDVIRFILDLRDRSRWLTYTYLLTNLLNHLGKGASDAAADAAARTTLNKLVQIGVLVVDREPREIEVGGTRHRVRLCHIVDDHPLIVSLRGQAETSSDAVLDGEQALSVEEVPVAE